MDKLRKAFLPHYKANTKSVEQEKAEREAGYISSPNQEPTGASTSNVLKNTGLANTAEEPVRAEDPRLDSPSAHETTTAGADAPLTRSDSPTSVYDDEPRGEARGVTGGNTEAGTGISSSRFDATDPVSASGATGASSGAIGNTGDFASSGTTSQYTEQTSSAQQYGQTEFAGNRPITNTSGLGADELYGVRGAGVGNFTGGGTSAGNMVRDAEHDTSQDFARGDPVSASGGRGLGHSYNTGNTMSQAEHDASQEFARGDPVSASINNGRGYSTNTNNDSMTGSSTHNRTTGQGATSAAAVADAGEGGLFAGQNSAPAVTGASNLMVDDAATTASIKSGIQGGGDELTGARSADDRFASQGTANATGSGAGLSGATFADRSVGSSGLRYSSTADASTGEATGADQPHEVHHITFTAQRLDPAATEPIPFYHEEGFEQEQGMQPKRTGETAPTETTEENATYNVEGSGSGTETMGSRDLTSATVFENESRNDAATTGTRGGMGASTLESGSSGDAETTGRRGLTYTSPFVSGLRGDAATTGSRGLVSDSTYDSGSKAGADTTGTSGLRDGSAHDSGSTDRAETTDTSGFASGSIFNSGSKGGAESTATNGFTSTSSFYNQIQGGAETTGTSGPSASAFDTGSGLAGMSAFDTGAMGGSGFDPTSGQEFVSLGMASEAESTQGHQDQSYDLSASTAARDTTTTGSSHLERDAAIGGAAVTGAAGAYEDRREQGHAVDTTDMGSAGPHASETLNKLDPRVQDESSHAQNISSSHTGRDTAALGGAGALGADAYENERNRDTTTADDYGTNETSETRRAASEGPDLSGLEESEKPAAIRAWERENSRSKLASERFDNNKSSDRYNSRGGSNNYNNRHTAERYDNRDTSDSYNNTGVSDNYDSGAIQGGTSTSGKRQGGIYESNQRSGQGYDTAAGVGAAGLGAAGVYESDRIREPTTDLDTSGRTFSETAQTSNAVDPMTTTSGEQGYGTAAGIVGAGLGSDGAYEYEQERNREPAGDLETSGATSSRTAPTADTVNPTVTSASRHGYDTAAGVGAAGLGAAGAYEYEHHNEPSSALGTSGATISANTAAPTSGWRSYAQSSTTTAPGASVATGQGSNRDYASTGATSGHGYSGDAAISGNDYASTGSTAHFGSSTRNNDYASTGAGATSGAALEAAAGEEDTGHSGEKTQRHVEPYGTAGAAGVDPSQYGTAHDLEHHIAREEADRKQTKGGVLGFLHKTQRDKYDDPAESDTDAKHKYFQRHEPEAGVIGTAETASEPVQATTADVAETAGTAGVAGVAAYEVERHYEPAPTTNVITTTTAPASTNVTTSTVPITGLDFTSAPVANSSLRGGERQYDAYFNQGNSTVGRNTSTTRNAVVLGGATMAGNSSLEAAAKYVYEQQVARDAATTGTATTGQGQIAYDPKATDHYRSGFASDNKTAAMVPAVSEPARTQSPATTSRFTEVTEAPAYTATDTAIPIEKTTAIPIANSGVPPPSKTVTTFPASAQPVTTTAPVVENVTKTEHIQRQEPVPVVAAQHQEPTLPVVAATAPISSVPAPSQQVHTTTIPPPTQATATTTIPPPTIITTPPPATNTATIHTTSPHTTAQAYPVHPQKKGFFHRSSPNKLHKEPPKGKYPVAPTAAAADVAGVNRAVSQRKA